MRLEVRAGTGPLALVHEVLRLPTLRGDHPIGSVAFTFERHALGDCETPPFARFGDCPGGSVGGIMRGGHVANPFVFTAAPGVLASGAVFDAWIPGS